MTRRCSSCSVRLFQVNFASIASLAVTGVQLGTAGCSLCHPPPPPFLLTKESPTRTISLLTSQDSGPDHSTNLSAPVPEKPRLFFLCLLLWPRLCLCLCRFPICRPGRSFRLPFVHSLALAASFVAGNLASSSASFAEALPT